MGATRIVRSTGIASSLVRIKKGRPLASPSPHQISPRPMVTSPRLLVDRAGRRVVRRGHVGLVLRDPLVPLDDAAPDVRPPFGIEEGLDGGPHRVGLRVEPPRGDEGAELFGETVWYANRYLNRHAKSIPPRPCGSSGGVVPGRLPSLDGREHRRAPARGPADRRAQRPAVGHEGGPKGR